MRKLGKCIRRAGRNDQQIRRMPQTNVQYVRFVAPQIVIDVGAPSCDRLECKWRNELFCSAREDRIHLCTGLGELGGQICSFIRGDGTRNTQDDAFA